MKVDSPILDSDGIELAPLDEAPDPVALKQLDEDRFIDKAFKRSFAVDQDRAAQVRTLATEMNIPTHVADVRLEEFTASWKAANFDPVQWGMDNPDLKKLVLEHPELGPEVVRNREVSLLTKALREVMKEGDTAIRERILQRQLREGLSNEEAIALVEQDTTTRDNAIERENAPKQVTVRQTPLSTELNAPAEPGLFQGVRQNLKDLEKVRQRYLEAGRGFEVAKEYSKLLRQRMLGQDTEQTENNLVDLKQRSFEQDFEENAVGQVLREVAETTASTVEGLKGGGIGLGTAVGIGGVVGLVSRNPGAGRAVTNALGPWLAKGGVALSTMELETGSQYQELLEAKDENGQPIDEKIARAGALFYGTVSTAIELGSLNVQLKAFGLGGGAARAEAAALIRRDATFRGILLRGLKAQVKASAAEGLEEGMQTAWGEAVEYFAASLNAGHLQSSGGPTLQAAEDAQKAFVGTFFGLGGVGAGVKLVQEVRQHGADVAAGKRVAAIARMADNESIRSFPAAAAQMIEKATTEDGEPVTSLHVDAQAFGRMFQGDVPELKDSPGLLDVRAIELAADKADELFGPGAGARFKEALTVPGGKLEVGLQDAISKLGGTPLLQKLTDDITTRPWRNTPNELKKNAAELEKQAQAIADANEEKATEESAVDGMFRELEADLVGTGRMNAREASAEVAPLRAFYRTQGERFGVAPAELFKAIRVKVGLGTFDLHPAPTELSERVYKGGTKGAPLEAEQRARDLFIDKGTGLRNVRAWDAHPRVPGKEIAVIALRAAKALNDDPQGGHDVAELPLNVMGGLVGSIDPEAARDGTKFRVHVDPGQLEAALAKIRTGLPPGLEVVGATGADVEQAGEALKKLEDEGEKLGTLPPRGKTKFDLTKLAKPADVFKGESAKTVPTADQISEAAELNDETFFREAYLDKDVPGVLNKVGFNHAGEKKWVLAMDGIGLGEINEKYGKAKGTEYIRLVSKIAQKVGGTAVNFSHLSGDEYAAKHDNKLELESFAQDLEVELHQVDFRAKNLKTGVVERVPVLIRFGVGAKTYGAADKVLNERKRAETAEDGPRSARAADRRDQLSRRGDLGARSTRAQRRGTRPQGFARPAEEASDGGGTGQDVGFNPLELEHSDESIAAARAEADRMRFPGKKQKAHAFLDFVLGKRSDRPKGISPAMERKFAESGFVAPDTLPAEFEAGHGSIAPRRRGKSTMDPAQKEVLRKQRAGEAPDAREASGITGNRKFQPPADGASGDNQAPVNPRGWTQHVVGQLERVFKVALNKNADLSTFLHESGHVMLELFADLSQRPDAPASLKEDWATMLKYLGADPAQVKRNEEGWSFADEHHEKFARSLEAFMREGKAPSSTLVRAFERVSLWLKQIYRSVLQLKVELNDDARGVFSRLLATDAEIQEYSEAMGLTRPAPLVADELTGLEHSNLTPEQYEAELEDLARIKNSVHRRVRLRALKDQLREKEAWWKAAETDVRREAEADYEQRNDVKALRFIMRGEFRATEDGPIVKVEESRLDRAAVEQLLGKDGTAKLFGKGHRLQENGVHPEEVADLLGFDSGAAMLEALTKVPERATWVQAEVLERMAEAFPDILNDREVLREEVGKGMHGDETAAWLLKQEHALRQATGAFRGGPQPIEAIKLAAKKMAEKKLVGKLGTTEALRAERKAAELSTRAAAKGDYGQAHAHKLQQLLQMYLFNELSKAKDEVEAFTEYAAALSKKAARARLGKASPAYRDGVDALLEAIGVKAPEDVRDQPLKSMAEVTRTMQLDGTSVMFDEEWVGWILGRARPLAPNNPTELKKLSLAEMRAVDQALKNIDGAAKVRGRVIVDEQKVDKELVLEALENEGRNNQTVVGSWLGAGGIPSSDSAANWKQRLAQLPALVTGPLMKPELLADLMGGRDRKSMWFRAVVKPLVDAGVLESDTLKGVIRPVLEAFEKMPKRAQEKFDGAGFFPTHRVSNGQNLAAPTKRFELYMMALNFGNQSNIDRLLEGRNISEAQVLAALNTLTKDELDWVQSVWDACEALKQPAFDLEERDSGLRPKEIEARPLRLDAGVWRGGYFPAIYDKRVSRVGEEQAVNEFLDPGFGRYGTAHGHLKSRSEGFRDVLQLEPSVIPRHLAQVAHDIAFREAIKSVGGLIMSPRIQALLKERLGDDRASQFQEWLKDVGTARGVDGAVKAGAWLRAAQKVRANTVLSAMAYSLPNFFEDFSALLSAVPATSLTTRNMTAGFFQWLKAPLASVKEVEAKSGTIRAANDQLQRDLTHRIEELTASGPMSVKPVRFLKRHAFVLIESTFKFTATPVWLGAYRQQLAASSASSAEAREADAVEFADKLVRQLFPMHSAVNSAGLVRDKGFIGTSLLFYGFQSTALNNVLDLAHQFGEADDVRGRVSAVARSLAYMTAIAAVGGWLRGRGPDQEGEDSWAAWYFRTMLLNALQLLPFGSDVASTIESIMKGKPVHTRPGLLSGAGIGVVNAVNALRDDEKDPDKKVDAVLRGLGPLVGAPGTSQALRTGKYLLDWTNDVKTPTGPLDVAGGVIYGGNQQTGPLNPFNTAGSDVPLAR